MSSLWFEGAEYWARLSHLIAAGDAQLLRDEEMEREPDEFGRDVFSVHELDAFRAGVQVSAADVGGDPDDPRSGAGRRRQAESAATDLYDAFESYAYRQNWLESEHSFGSVTMTGAEFVQLSKRLGTDKDMQLAVRRALAAKGYTAAQIDQALSDVPLLAELGQMSPEERERRGLQDEYERASKSQAAKDAVEAAKRWEQGKELDDQSVTRREYDAETSSDEAGISRRILTEFQSSASPLTPAPAPAPVSPPHAPDADVSAKANAAIPGFL